MVFSEHPIPWKPRHNKMLSLVKSYGIQLYTIGIAKLFSVKYKFWNMVKCKI